MHVETSCFFNYPKNYSFFEIMDIFILNYAKYYLLTKTQELTLSTYLEAVFSTYVSSKTR